MLATHHPILALLLIIGCCTAPLWGQHRETFESSKPSWQLRESDCTLPKQQWLAERVDSQTDSGRFERIQFQSGNGTRILVSHPIPKSRMISELVPSLRVRSNRPGVQLMVRVVLPNTPDEEDSSRPMKTLLKGPVTTGSGSWQTLSFADGEFDLKAMLDRHMWVLRRKYGSHVSDKSAYVDLLVLNLYTGVGRHQVDIDDLRVDGIVSADKIRGNLGEPDRYAASVRSASTSYVQQPRRTSSHVKRKGTVIEVHDKPYFGRVIQHNGEPFELLKSLGFNAVELRASATEAQLTEAKDAGVWLVCPPPPSAGLTSIGPEFDSVLAWSVGQNVSLRDLAGIRETIREVRESDLRKGRPIVANVHSGWAQIGQVADILNVGFEPLGSSFVLNDYSEWILKRSQAVGHNHPIWGDLQTEISREVSRQVAAMVGAEPPTPIEPQQLKYMAYEILSAGARGIRFRSRSRLDADDPSSRLRATTLKWLNRHLQQIEPWVAGGVLLTSRNADSAEIKISPIRTSRSQLLLVQRPTGKEQHFAGEPVLATVMFDNEGAPMSDRAYGIADHGLVPLDQRRDHLGARVEMTDCPFTGAVVLTKDPSVVTRLNQSYEHPGQTLVQVRTELIQQWLAVMQLIQNQTELESRSSAAAGSALAEAANALRKAEALINAGSPGSSTRFLELADQRMATVRRELLTAGLRQFRSKTSSPLLMHVSLVPLHWRISHALSGSTWQPNTLPGGDFEDLQHMTQNGWENRRLEIEGLETKVELAKAATVDGQYALKMSVTGNPGQRLIESSPLWIGTGRVPVKAGQMVRIHGWVKIDRPIQGSMDGLIISDSLSGPGMAERILVTSGWQEFALYRAASSNANLQVKFELTGVGEVLLDEITIRAVEIPVHQERQARR